jgi:type I restriction enzyme R subunit
MKTLTNTKESGFEEFIEQELVQLHSFRVRPTSGASSAYDVNLCMDTEVAFEFLQKTQPDELKKLEDQYGAEYIMKLFERLDSEITSRGVLSVLREGIVDRGVRLKLAYWKPQTTLNEQSIAEYRSNIFTVMRQVKYSLAHGNSIDMVLCINGLPIFTLELKNQLTGQTVKDAMTQYQTDRSPQDKLLSFRRCLTHFAVDTELVFMTTKLAGLKTYFLPFNKGNKASAENPVVKDKYKTHYLWEDIFATDNILDLLANFIQEQEEEKIDSKGKKTKDIKLIFPRYHQFDTVRRLVDDARVRGTGQNYLIQHSAGSGKSNTIAWTAHRLAELHDEQDVHIFDTVIVITDKRVLDRQLSKNVNDFSQVGGTVQHVESSAELKLTLESGVRIITSTLQKFPVIADTIEQTAGKKFAVIIDEAHSSQSGESSADLREVLTLEKAEELANKEEESAKSSEDVINERVGGRQDARKIKTPNISFFAFTATPKNKTLELFGTKDSETGKYSPFALYSMKQAIDEKFIIDVLKSYTTYETYFGLLKRIENDPEFNKKKAQRLLIGYVEKHDHAIEKKSEIIVEHFEEKIRGEIDGRAKAMIVTKSRLHAVRYKKAVDAYLKLKGYPYKALVAFSGTVKDGDIEYTESNMNGVSESKTAETFKGDEYKLLIVANKFQTGFDQPLLSAMYVDKRLGGVNAVQTLSRLNRTTTHKETVFVLDFVNNIEDIRESFQPYFTTTILSESTDPNILHDIERDILQFRLFSSFEINGFIEEYFSGATPAKLNSILDSIVTRVVEEKNDEEAKQFKGLVGDYIKKYAFISQIITFEDPQLEKMFVFLKFLNKKLPVKKDELPYEILESVDMDTYKVQKKSESAIVLDTTESELDPVGKGDSGIVNPIEEIDHLSRIIKEINDRYGTNFSENDKVILSNLGEQLMKSETLRGSIDNNSKDSAKIKFDELFQDELVGMLNNHFDLYKKLDESPELKKFVNERMFEMVVKKMQNKTDKEKDNETR